ncbi:MAG: NAD-glutamate dehydrogenase [Pseudomonadota bacterium]
MTLEDLVQDGGPLADVVQAVQAHPDAGDPLAAHFAARFFATTDASSLRAFDAAQLATQAAHAFAFARARPEAGHALKVRDGGLNGGLAIEIINDDMPFLLDSIVGEIHARGLELTLVLHPILATRREGGVLVALDGPDAAHLEGWQLESFIAIHTPALDEAAQAELTQALKDVMRNVRQVVSDWKPMVARIQAEIDKHRADPPAAIDPDLLDESLAFLSWIASDHFTFLGVREYKLHGDPETGDLVPVTGSGLGLLCDPTVQVLRRGREMVTLTPEIRRFFFQPDMLIITKANVVSNVHRRVHMDYIGIKMYRPDGSIDGELRVTGLFTSSAYTQSPADIPFLRLKVRQLMGTLGFPARSHTAKAVHNVVETFPRDELFQIGVQRLAGWLHGILDLEMRPRVRTFVRADRFERFVSILAYVPRDRYSTATRKRIGAYLSRTFDGWLSAFYPYFIEGGAMVRVQFIIGRSNGATPQVEEAELEAAITDIITTWPDRVRHAVRASAALPAALAGKYAEAFPAGYAETVTIERALADIASLERLSDEAPVRLALYAKPGAEPGRLHASVYARGTPIALSDRVPVLENLGFRVIDERTFTVRPGTTGDVRPAAQGETVRTGETLALHDMVLVSESPLDLARSGAAIEDAFIAVLAKRADDDGYNKLIAAVGTDWQHAALLRAYGAYLRQLGLPFDSDYLAATLVRHPTVAADFLALFQALLDPDAVDDSAAMEALENRIAQALNDIPSLEEDRVLRHFHNLITSTLRTNFYQRERDPRTGQMLALKLDSARIDGAPQPRPYREIWVFSPQVEGVHLRYAPLARGGLRWSDRPQDFRIEVLGLAKAQQVKNAVIVPAGAKGGFVPKTIDATQGRDAIFAQGRGCYEAFVASLLAITDNRRGNAIVTPPGVKRRDGDDPYLVVAADKGTATFSDTANAISQAYDFWLGDAFASGGSAGYDHKKMGITARGAWACVQRHFREMDHDIQRQPFTAIGVGDMSGDVFGNGMLLSDRTRLLAAFDHRDIFIDPDPDPSTSFAERKRLFEQPRSSWQDYDPSVLSTGGGIYARNAKAVDLSAQACAFLGFEVGARPTPVEVMRAILRSEADLLWFGGIGTYVRASSQTDADADDRGNDPIRITAPELKVRVVGEGANLGLTQRARIEFAQNGGALNTDFIDNSAGVNSSDLEVNIKIALRPLVADGSLSEDQRLTLLSEMTDDVAAACLRNNEQQSLAISLAQRRGASEVGAFNRLMEALETRGLLDRGLDELPLEAEARARQTAGEGFTRPEIAQLLSVAKIALLADLLETDTPDDPAFEDYLTAYFPEAMRTRTHDAIAAHPLRREIIATALTNDIINRLGPATPTRFADETGRSADDIANAFMAARLVFGLPALWAKVDALDNVLAGATQLGLYRRLQEALQRHVAWFVRAGVTRDNRDAVVERHGAGVASLAACFDDVASRTRAASGAALAADLKAQSVPENLVDDVVRLHNSAEALMITQIAHDTGCSVPTTARVLFDVTQRFNIDAVNARASALPLADYFDRMAVNNALGSLNKATSAITCRILSNHAGDAAAIDVDAWYAREGQRFAGTAALLRDVAEAQALTVSRLTVAATQIRDLTTG